MIKTKLLNYKDLYVYQDKDMFNFSLESILIARFITWKNHYKEVLDIGTNNGVIPIILNHLYNANVLGVDIEPKAIELAQRNAKVNNMEDKLTFLCEDFLNFKLKSNDNKYKLVVCNPPFFKVDHKSKLTSKSDLLCKARHEVNLKFEDLVYKVSKIIDNAGIFVITHRSERLDEIVSILNRNKFAIKKIQFIHPYPNRKSKTFLLEAKYNIATNNVLILPPIISHKPNGEYSDEVTKYFQK